MNENQIGTEGDNANRELREISMACPRSKLLYRLGGGAVFVVGCLFILAFLVLVATVVWQVNHNGNRDEGILLLIQVLQEGRSHDEMVIEHEKGGEVPDVEAVMGQAYWGFIDEDLGMAEYILVFSNGPAYRVGLMRIEDDKWKAWINLLTAGPGIAPDQVERIEHGGE